MLIIDTSSAVPLTDQIVQGIRYAIASGQVLPGQELPAVRQLAGDLQVNLNTVARAYRVLEASGLVRTGRGRGTQVTADREREVDADQCKETIRNGLGASLADARLAGLTRKEAERLVQDHLAALWPKRITH